MVQQPFSSRFCGISENTPGGEVGFSDTVAAVKNDDDLRSVMEQKTVTVLPGGQILLQFLLDR